MKCDRCKIENATIHLTQFTGEDVVSVNLCASCAQQAGIEESGNHKTNLISALKFFAAKVGANQSAPEDKKQLDPSLKNRHCLTCGLTGEELARTGLLGCPACYHAFNEKLKKDFQTFHRHMRHHGRGLSPVDSALFAQNMALAKLRESLNHAVQVENYEEAAELRDRLFSLEHGVESKNKR